MELAPGVAHYSMAYKGLVVRFLRHTPRQDSVPYSIHPPYGEERSRLLARRPAIGEDAANRPFGRLYSVVADVGFDDYLMSVYLFADGTISIYSSAGIHSTGLHGAQKVASAATAILEDVEQALGDFSPIDDLGELPLPSRGHSQILARTYDGDFAAMPQPGSKGAAITRILAMAYILSRLARQAVVEGFDRTEVGETLYEVEPEYRRLRASLMDWMPAPGQLAAAARVASVVVEVGDAETQAVTSLFVFADGSASVYRSDGKIVEGLSGKPGVADSARALFDAVDRVRSIFGPSDLVLLPQPGLVQFVVRVRLIDGGEWKPLFAIATREALADGSHPLSAAFAHANQILEISR